MDEMLKTPEGKQEINSLSDKPGSNEVSDPGCTANVCLITKQFIYCANAGDSRSYLYSNKKPIELSFDHKPENEAERIRITNAGGFISMGRVNGNLNLSRAIGDIDYKKNNSQKPHEQLISAMPDVTKTPIKPEHNFIVMGCDGVWEIQSIDEICGIIERKLKNNNEKISSAMEEVLDKGLAPDTSTGKGCDNMSGCIIKFQH